MSLFAVQYTYTDDTATRDAHRAEHRAFLAALGDEGLVLLSGPLADGVGQADAALIVVSADAPEVILERLADDPFQRHGVIENVEIRGWQPVLGAWYADHADEL